MNTYAYKISNGHLKEAMNHSTTFLIFTDNKEKADKFIANYVAEEIEEDKFTDDDGLVKNWWWLHYRIDEVDIRSLTVANIEVID